MLVALLGQAGTSVRGAYDVLVSMAIIAYFLPYLFLFAAMIRLQRRPAGPEVRRVPGGRPVAIALASVGFVSTAVTVVLSAIPGADETNKPLAVAKVLGGTVVLVGAGVAVFLASLRRPSASPSHEREIISFRIECSLRLRILIPRGCVLRQVLLCLGVALCSCVVAFGQAAQTIHGRDGIVLPPPPAVEKTPVVDNYFGTKITDNYRWLEDAKSPETRAFIDAENAYTARYFKQARIRPDVADDLDALEHVSRWTMPIERADSYFFEKRLAGEEQASIYVRHGWTGKDERLIDPAAISRDPNTSVLTRRCFARRLAPGLRCSPGWCRRDEHPHLRHQGTERRWKTNCPSGRYFGIDFTPDGDGIYYTTLSQARYAALPPRARNAQRRTTP